MSVSKDMIPRDWAVSLTDVLLSSVAALIAYHAAAGASISTIISTATAAGRPVPTLGQLAAFSFFEISICAFLGSICWGPNPNNKTINAVYRTTIELTKFASVPFLLSSLIRVDLLSVGPLLPLLTSSPQIAEAIFLKLTSPIGLFSFFHAAFITTILFAPTELKLKKRYASFKETLSTLLVVIPLIILAIQAGSLHVSLESGGLQQQLLLFVVGSFILVALVSENIPLFHVVMCAALWAVESARTGNWVTGLITF